MQRKDLANSGVVSGKEKTFNIIVFILLAVGALSMVFPFFYMVMTSFMTKNQYLSAKLTVIPSPWVFGKYAEVLRKGSFLSGIRNTILVEVPVLLIGGFTSSLAALRLPRCVSDRRIFLHAVACNNDDSLCRYHDSAVRNVYEVQMDGHTSTAYHPGMLWKHQHDFFLRQNLSSIPDDLMDAAKIDGCGYFRTFIQIFFPLMKGAVGTQLTLWFMGIWNDYLAPTIFLRSEKKWTLQVVIRSFNTYYSIQSDYALIMAASVIAMLPTIILFFCFQRVIIESVAISGIK